MHEPTLQNKCKSQDQGFALPLVVIIGLFLMIGGFAMMARTFGAFRGSIKSSQQQQAQELAEEGVSEIIDQLNRNYRYLWVNCHNSGDGSCTQNNIGGWNNAANTHGGDLPQLNQSASCLSIGNQAPTRTANNYSDNLILGAEINPASNAGSQAKRGEWSLLSYTFRGDPWIGGRGIIRVQGNRTDSQQTTKASAIIDHHIEVKGKPCNQRLTDSFTEATFPGLLAEDINLGNNDIIGHPSANVYCTKCTSTSDLNKNVNNSVVDGDIFTGTVALPPVPVFPKHLAGYVQAGDLITPNGSQIQIVIDPPNAPLTAFNPTNYTPPANIQNPKPMCITDEKSVTHCKVNDITLNGNASMLVKTYPNALKIGTRPVRLYLNGNINGRGGAMIDNTSNSTSLSIFGPQTCNPSQTITVGGNATIKAFIYAPCADVGINGGSTKATCKQPNQLPQQFNNRTTNPAGTACEGGDFEGAIWSKAWSEKSGGSGANVAEITVPKDIEDELTTIFGEKFTTGPIDFVGVGAPRWASYQQAP